MVTSRYQKISGSKPWSGPEELELELELELEVSSREFCSSDSIWVTVRLSNTALITITPRLLS